MTRAAFGQHLDLHAGGVDLAFPHHENEIAQWRGCNADLTGTWCKCWLHTGHLHIEDIVQFTQEVVEQGYGYTTTDGSVWFDVAKLGSSYGAFAEGRGTSTAAAQAAALIEEDPASASDNKRDQRDFALWKAAKEEEISWPSPWGDGRQKR